MANTDCLATAFTFDYMANASCYCDAYRVAVIIRVVCLQDSANYSTDEEVIHIATMLSIDSSIVVHLVQVLPHLVAASANADAITAF